MEINRFIEKAMKQDKRNCFEKCQDINKIIPESLKIFFKEYNPVDVEVSMNRNMVKMYSSDSLENLQSDYGLDSDRFVFATCNSDPIYIFNKKIYTCYHGTAEVYDELIAQSFEEFLSLID